MILADTSIWIDHFRKRDTELSRQLRQNNISIHPFIVAELALGNLPDRRKSIAYLDLLPRVKVAQMSEVRHMIEAHALFQKGIGLVDVHLIASSFMTPQTVLWSRDRRLHDIAETLGINARIP